MIGRRGQAASTFVREALLSPSEPLPTTTRAAMEKRFHHDFSRVRVYHDDKAAASAEALHAHAYATEDSIVFGRGRYAPAAAEGRRLLEHELSHVVHHRMPGRLFRQTKVGPVRSEGGLIKDEFKRMSVIIGATDTLSSVAKKLLPLWNNATPVAAGGGVATVPTVTVTEDELARAIAVYHHYYLPMPAMTNWAVGLRLPLPIDVTPSGEQIVSPGSIQLFATSFEAAWEPLLDQKPAATKEPKAADLTAQAESFLVKTTDPDARGMHLVTKFMTNALAARPFVEEVFRQLGSSGFETALGTTDFLGRHQADLLASQDAGLAIIDILRRALATAPADVPEKQKASLKSANELFNGIGTFGADKAKAIEQLYLTEVSSNCMTAVYKGLKGIYSPESSKSVTKEVQSGAREVMKRTGQDTNTMDRIIRVLESRGKAGAGVTLTYSSKTKTWTPDPETAVLGLTSGIAGWYFFAVSLHGAYHSVLLAVDKVDLATPKIYWLDQFSRGFKDDVTGKLIGKMKKFEPSYGFSPTTIHQLIPAADTLIELH
ncbi:MAG: eCIS core domain-containing protein [Thermoanaerobaculia bacterium]